jgi:hypothetical protein
LRKRLTAVEGHYRIAIHPDNADHPRSLAY